MKKIILDTSALMANSTIIDKLIKEYQVILPIVVIEELDNLKTNRDIEKSSKARQAINNIKININRVSFDLSNKIAQELLNSENNFNTNDNIIVSSALFNLAKLCTCDLNLEIKAKALNLETVECPTNDLYKGYKRIYLTDEEIAKFYESMNSNIYNLNINEYLLIYNKDYKHIDTAFWDGKKYSRVNYLTAESRMFGCVKPQDEFQLCALNSLHKNEVTVLYGKAGTGKSYLALSYLMKLLENNDIDKIYLINSYDTLKNAKTLGYEKGTHEEKILTTGSIGNILATKFGDISQVKSLLMTDKLEIIPTANIRGIECKSNSAVYVTEVQNLDIYTLKTIIQRCKTGCKQIYEGDIIEQKDVDINQSGIERMLEVFKNDNRFGCVKLKCNYRNTLSELADKM